jgi:signal transduction histidine kinase
MLLQILIYLGGLLNVLFGFYALFSRNKRPETKWFVCVAFVTAYWVFTNPLLANLPSFLSAEFWVRNVYAAGSLVAPAALLWLLVLILGKIKIWQLLLISLPTVAVFFLTYVDGLVIKNVETTSIGGWEGTTGPLFVVYSLFSSLIVLTVFSLLLYGYFTSQGIKKKQLKNVLLGALFFGSIVIVVSFLLPLRGIIQFTQLDSPSSVFFVGAIGYAILRNKLLDIKVIATQLLTLVLDVFLFGRLFFATTTSELVFDISVFILGLVLGFLLVRSVVGEVRRREETEQVNKSLKALQAITRRITESLDFTEVTQEVVDAVKEKLGYIGAVALTLDADRKTVRAQTITRSKVITKSLSKLPRNFKVITGNITDENLTHDIIRKDSVAISNDLSDFISPAVDPMAAGLIQVVLGMKSMVGVPISVEGKVHGALLFALAKPSLEVKPQEIETMKALGDQLGIISRNIGIIQELKRLDKAKSEFVSIASHQLRTPITAAKGYISMIMEGDYGKLPKNISKPLEIVMKNNDRLIELISNLLNLSRIEGGRFVYEWSEVDLREVINDVAAIILPQAAAKGLKVNVILPKNPTYVRADKEKLRQLVMNITDNSVKYTNKGSITLALQKDAKAKTFIYSVKDTGIGISPSDLPFLFQKFTRGTGSSVMHTQGTGLGLYVARKVAEEHKAKVWAESAGEGKGSTFSLEIPALKRRARLAKTTQHA